MSAVSTISSNATPYAGASASGLRVELADLKKEHSACVNCASASTPEGRLNIQKLETQISGIEAKLVENRVSEARPSASVDSGYSATGRIDLYA
jgi:hypothetical protein